VPTDAVGVDDHAAPPAVDVLLSIDAEYRTTADLNRLQTIAPRRFNPTRAHWLPVLHAERDSQDLTAMVSNTARAHELGHTDDWVIISDDGADDMSWTVVTELNGGCAGQRVVSGVTAPERVHGTMNPPQQKRAV
jgi:DNA polymerase (family 10)